MIEIFKKIYKRFSLDHEGKEKIQFSLRTNFTGPGEFMTIPMEDTNESLQIGLTRHQEFWIQILKQRLVQPSIIVPNEWHKVTITKQHQRLSLKVNQHQEILYLDEFWPKISWADKPLNFSGKF